MDTSSKPTADSEIDRLDDAADELAQSLLAGTLPKSCWTHDGHVLACVSLVRRHGPAEALRILRATIPSFNTATGVANTATSGYHDTITVFYVWAVDRLLADGLDTAAILSDPSVGRSAPLVWWDRETLMSPAARAAWLPPTRGAERRSQPREWLQHEVSRG